MAVVYDSLVFITLITSGCALGSVDDKVILYCCTHTAESSGWDMLKFKDELLLEWLTYMTGMDGTPARDTN